MQKFVREYFADNNLARQAELLGEVLKKIETNTRDHDTKLFQELNNSEFIALEFSSTATARSKQKNNLLVRLLQDFTAYGPSHLKLMKSANFVDRMCEIYCDASSSSGHTKCSWKTSCCSQACVLRTLCNVSCTASMQLDMFNQLQRLRLLPKLCAVHEMCPATAWSAMFLLDNLTQCADTASALFAMLPKPEFFNCLLAHLTAPLPKMDTSAERKRYFEFKQCLQSIIINLSHYRIAAYATVFQFSDFAFPKAMVNEIINESRCMHNALVSLCIFAARNSHATFVLCQRILDTLLTMSTDPQAEVQLKMNAIKLLSLFFGTRELSCPDSQWIRKLQRGVRSDNADVGMWSTLCLALLEREHIPSNVSEDVVEALVDYLDVVNVDEDLPCNMMLDVICNVMQRETRNLNLFKKHGIQAHLHISLEAAFANRNALAFVNALRCLEVCTSDTQQELLQEFSRGFASNQARTAQLQEMLLRCDLHLEDQLATPKRIRQTHVFDHMPLDSPALHTENDDDLDAIQEIDMAPMTFGDDNDDDDLAECKADANAMHALHVLTKQELELFVHERLTLQVLRAMAPQDSTNVLLSLGFSQQTAHQLVEHVL